MEYSVEEQRRMLQKVVGVTVMPMGGQAALEWKWKQDQLQPFTVAAVGEGKAQITMIGVTDQKTAKSYKVYPEGEQAYCTPGAGNLGLAIQIKNVGDIAARLYMCFRNPATGAIIKEWFTDFVNPGATYPIATTVTDMPPAPYNLQAEAWHEYD